MVKVADLGYQDTNLQDVGSEEERKRKMVEEAIENLAKAEPPSRLTNTSMPNSLTNISLGSE